MEYTYPQYFYDFQCEASACSDTCCAGWEIDIDDKSYQYTRAFSATALKILSTGKTIPLSSTMGAAYF